MGGHIAKLVSSRAELNPGGLRSELTFFKIILYECFSMDSYKPLKVIPNVDIILQPLFSMNLKANEKF